MQKIELVRHLLKNATGANPATTTIAKTFKVTASVIEQLKTQINSDGIYSIQSGKGGGLSITPGPKDESATYPFIASNAESWITSSIYGRHGVTKQIIEPTHKKKLSGKWSTPDFSSVCVHKFLHVPGSAVEIVSIEAKHSEKQFDVSCVYEAFAHSRVSSYTVLFFFDDPANTIEDRGAEAILEEIKIECGRLGVGLVISDYPSDKDTWRYIIPARQQTPDKRRVDAYIEEAFSDSQQKELKKLL